MRKGAKKSPEEAAVLTSYPQLQAMGIGQAGRGVEYLPLIADAFGIDDDLWLLAYAWLVDTLSPSSRQACGTGDRAGDEENPVHRSPARHVNLPDFASLMTGRISQSELAVACLVARYGPSPGATDVPMILRPTKRNKLATFRSRRRGRAQVALWRHLQQLVAVT